MKSSITIPLILALFSLPSYAGKAFSCNGGKTVDACIDTARAVGGDNAHLTRDAKVREPYLRPYILSRSTNINLGQLLRCTSQRYLHPLYIQTILSTTNW
jgi:hypothetical protein